MSEPKILGSLHPATADGFKTMIKEANEAWAGGYELIGFERLDEKLGAVYRRAPTIQAEADPAFLVGE
jgi:hypothetical protein